MKYSALILFATFTVFSFTSCDGQKKSKGDDRKITTVIDSVSYGIGSTIGRNLKKDGLDSIDVDLLAKGIRDEFSGKTDVMTAEAAQAVIGAYVQGIQAKKQEANVSKVTTHYHGTLLDGKVFDSSVDRGQPVSFAVNGVIPGWTEALQLMPVGSKWKLFIPSNLAYGERGAGGDIGPNETLIFDVELISIDPK